MAVNENIKKLRKSKRFTQQELADLAGVSKATIVNIENGLTNPDTKTIDKVALALGIAVNDLYSNEQPVLPVGENSLAVTQLIKELEKKDEQINWYQNLVNQLMNLVPAGSQLSKFKGNEFPLRVTAAA